MSALKQTQAAALLAVSKSVKEYADGMTLDIYGDTRQYERDWHTQDHFRQLADHLKEAAQELVNWPTNGG